METNPISDKVTAAVVAGAVTTIVVWVAQAAANVEIPAAVATAITTILAAAAAWFKKDPVRDAGVTVLNSDPAVDKENVEQVAEDLIRAA